jgi:hypothetical protein
LFKRRPGGRRVSQPALRTPAPVLHMVLLHAGKSALAEGRRPCCRTVQPGERLSVSSSFDF